MPARSASCPCEQGPGQGVTSRRNANAAIGRYAPTTGNGPDTHSRVRDPEPLGATSWRNLSWIRPIRTDQFQIRSSSSTSSTTNVTATPRGPTTRPLKPRTIRSPAVSTRRIWGAQSGQRRGSAYRSHTSAGASEPVAEAHRVVTPPPCRNASDRNQRCTKSADSVRIVDKNVQKFRNSSGQRRGMAGWPGRRHGWRVRPWSWR